MAATPTASGSRPAATRARREAILRAALACFTRDGVEASSIARIRREAKASVGSIYHHFASKEGIAAELYLEGIRRHQAGLLERLARERDPRRGVESIARHLLDWVAREPDWARYLLTMRRAAFIADVADRIAALNADLGRGVQEWLAPHVAAGRIEPLPFDLFMAVVAGPCLEWARRWLDDQDAAALRRARRDLARAAWKAVRAG